MPTQAQGYLSLLVDTASSGGPTYTKIPGVTVVNGLGFGENRIDVTDLDTPVGSTESISGPRPNSPLTFTMHDENGNTVQEKLHTAGDDNTAIKFQLLRGTKAQNFTAVPVITLAGSVGGVVTYNVSLTPEAKPTRTTVTP